MKEYLTLVTAPASLPLTVEAAKVATRVCDDTDDEFIRTLIKAAARLVDGRDGYLGRALISQRWKLILDSFPDGSGKIIIPLPPLQTVHSIIYIDEAGASQTLATDKYRVVSDVEPAFIEPLYGTEWPWTRDVEGTVRIEFTAGYGATWDKVPDEIRTYLSLQVAEWYNNRELNIVGTSISEIPHVRNMLENVRIRGATNEGRPA